MRQRRGEKRFEMQNVSFDVFAIFPRKDGIVVKQFHNLVRSFEFRRQLSVLIEEVVDTHKNLLVQGELVNLEQLQRQTICVINSIRELP